MAADLPDAFRPFAAWLARIDGKVSDTAVLHGVAQDCRLTPANLRALVAAGERMAAMEDALRKIAEREGDCDHQHFYLTRFQASQIARAALPLAPKENTDA